MHLALGPFGNTHSLCNIGSILISTIILAIYTKVSPSGSARCSECHLDLNNASTKVFVEHCLRLHTGMLPPMSSMARIRQYFSSSAIFCSFCNIIHPSTGSLVLHAFLANHVEFGDSYCHLCETLLHNTNLFEHHLLMHPFIQCPICSVFLPVVDFVGHMLSPSSHETYPLEILKPFFNVDLHDILQKAQIEDQFRKTNSIQYEKSKLHQDSLSLYKPCLTSAPGFNILLERIQPDTYPFGLSRIITDSLPFLVGADIASLIALLDNATTFSLHRSKIEQYHYELLQLILYREYDGLISYSTKLHISQLKTLFWDHIPVTMRKEVSQSPLWIRDAPTMNQFLPKNIGFIIAGCRVLRMLGTHPTTENPIVNLSTQTVSVFPTTYYNCVDGGTDGSGYIELSTVPKIPVYGSISYLRHLYNVLPNVPDNVLVILELDVSTVLSQVPAHLLQRVIKVDLQSLLFGQFSGLHELFSTKLTAASTRRIIVINQLPFTLKALSIEENLKLMANISNLNLHLALLFRMTILPTYSLVGIGMSSRTTLNGEEGPTFDLEGNYSPKTVRELKTVLVHFTKKCTYFFNHK